VRRALLRTGYRLGFSNASGSSLIWAGTDRYDIKRWGMDRSMTDATFLGQAALPQLGHRARSHMQQQYVGLT